MNAPKTDDVRIREIREVSSPWQLLAEMPVSKLAAEITFNTRREIHSIMDDGDDRILAIVGPCSIHDVAAAREYAGRLLALRDELKGEIIVVMRVYFEKPRTTVGWKGLINDPGLDSSFDLNRGLRLARQLLLDLNEMGVPAGTEYLDIITPQYVADLISWGAIGARTTESQVHREVASGLSCPVGFKNGTDGNLKVAVDAIRAAREPHHFLSLTKEGRSAIFSTTGNEDAHVILRGGKAPNYEAEHVDSVSQQLESAGLRPQVMIDLSHANSSKDHERQTVVGQDVCDQMSAGDQRIMGVMIESHLVPGRQDVVPGKALTYGQSITDACIGWNATVTVLQDLAAAVRARRARPRAG